MLKKKLLVTGLIAIMALNLVACGDKKEAATTATQAPKAAATAAPADAGSSDSDSSAAMEQIKSKLDCGYMGAADSDDNTGMYLAMNADATFSVLVIASADSNENMSFVGSSADNGDGTITINDESSQTAITFGVTDNGDGTYTLSYGDIGTGTVSQCSVDKVLDAMQKIDANTTSVN